MPLFGKKSKDDSGKNPGYPTQSAYPQQSAPPPAGPAAPPPYQHPGASAPPAYGAPPAYQPQTPQAVGYAAPPPAGYQPPPAGYQQPPAGYQQPPAGYQQPPPPHGYHGQPGYQQAQWAPGPATNVVVQGGYDAGARFDGVATANIPPPPPGVAPNAAQMAAAQGNTVVMGQRPGNFVTGGSDGGYTIW